MIRFADKLDSTESTKLPDLSNYKEIKPVLKTTDDKVNSFWSEVFGDEDSSEDIYFSEDDILSQVFERNETDFDFEFVTYKRRGN